MAGPRYPALYQINTRAWLRELGATLGRPATLEDVSDASIDQLAADGFHWVWLLGIWQTGDGGRQVSLNQPEWQAEYRELLPDFTADDVRGSPFAIRDYLVNGDFRGPPALERFRKRLAPRGRATPFAALGRSSGGPPPSPAPGALARSRATGPGPPTIRSGRRPPSTSAGGSRASCSWPRPTGTWSGRSSSRGSTTPTTSGSTITCTPRTRARFAATSPPTRSISAAPRDSWRTTTSRAPPPPFRRPSTRRPACSPSSCRASASSTRGNARVGDCEPPTICAAGRRSPSIRS